MNNLSADITREYVGNNGHLPHHQRVDHEPLKRPASPTVLTSSFIPPDLRSTNPFGAKAALAANLGSFNQLQVNNVQDLRSPAVQSFPDPLETLQGKPLTMTQRPLASSNTMTPWGTKFPKANRATIPLVTMSKGVSGIPRLRRESTVMLRPVMGSYLPYGWLEANGLPCLSVRKVIAFQWLVIGRPI